MSLEDNPSDVSYLPSSGSSQSSPDSDSGSASANGDGWAERKWLVSESRLLQLCVTCTVCGVAVAETKTTTHSSQIKIQWICQNNHSGTWASCPDRRGMAENNLLISASILFTGTSHTTLWTGLIFYTHTNPQEYTVLQDARGLPHTGCTTGLQRPARRNHQTSPGTLCIGPYN